MIHSTTCLFWQGKIMPNGTRDSTLELLLGDNGWVTHYENGICYSLDATKCMFSSGNRSEKLRMGQLNCRDEVVVDLFAGIGYFVLPFLVKYILFSPWSNTSDSDFIPSKKYYS
jgi:tRNA wybutosine-synthesizing protein 3